MIEMEEELKHVPTAHKIMLLNEIKKNYNYYKSEWSNQQVERLENLIRDEINKLGRYF